MTVVRVQGRDLADFGLAIRELEGWLDRSDSERARVPWIGRAGEWVSRQEVGSPRRVRVLSWTTESSVANRDAVLAELRSLLSPGTLLEVSFGDQPTKRLLAYPTRDEVRGIEARRPLALGQVEVEHALTAFQSVKIDATPVVVAIPTGAFARVPVGTAPSYGTLWIRAPSVEPMIDLYDFRGERRGRITFSATIAAPLAWKIDLAERRVQRVDATGAETDADGDVLSWTDDFTFRPEFGHRALGHFPYVTSTSGSGVIVTRRHWLT